MYFDPEDDAEHLARLRRFHTALLSSLDPAGDLRSFYHITANEEKGLEKAVHRISDATSLQGVQQFFVLWLEVFKRAGSTITSRWRLVKQKDAQLARDAQKILQATPAL